MQSTERTASKDGIVIAFVLPKKRLSALEALLDKFATNEWRESGSIFLISVYDQYVNSAGHTRSAIRKQANDFGLSNGQDNIRYIVIDEFRADVRRGMDWVKHADFFHCLSFKKLADDLLDIKLKEWHLDWKSSAVAQVKKWQHDELTERDVEDWLRQFDKVSDGTHRWVGERLLRNFRVWSSQQVTQELAKNYGVEALLGQACIIRYENGKSADSIAVMLRKKLPYLLGDRPVLEYREFLEKNACTDCFVFEDGAFTGIEIGDLFRSLMGVEGYNKCEPLRDKSLLKTLATNLHFAIATDIGLDRIEAVVRELGIAVKLTCGTLLPVLSNQGKERLNAGLLYDKDEQGKVIFRSPDEDIIPQAFLDSNWGARRGEALAFCKKIGTQLFTSYQEKKGKFWTDRRISECAIGAGNMGLLLAFAHSLPKSTMPFFWCHGGVVDPKGNAFAWKPLFPSAHTL